MSQNFDICKERKSILKGINESCKNVFFLLIVLKDNCLKYKSNTMKGTYYTCIKEINDSSAIRIQKKVLEMLLQIA